MKLRAKTVQRLVRLALSYAGIDTSDHPIYAKNYGPYLKKWGYKEISKDNNKNPQIGDIRVFQSYPGQKPPAGHIDMYNGKNWVSDFIEKHEWPGKVYRIYKNFKYYRR